MPPEKVGRSADVFLEGEQITSNLNLMLLCLMICHSKNGTVLAGNVFLPQEEVFLRVRAAELTGWAGFERPHSAHIQSAARFLYYTILLWVGAVGE